MIEDKPETEQERTPEEMREGRAEVMAENCERLANIAIDNAAACQVLLSIELNTFIDPTTGQPTEKHMQLSSASKIRELAEAAHHCRQLI